MSVNETILRTRSVAKEYGGKAAVDKVSITISKGDIYGLIGRNGAGKTTLMKIITSLTKSNSGEVELFGETSAAGLNNARRRIGCVIEMPALYIALFGVPYFVFNTIMTIFFDKSHNLNYLYNFDFSYSLATLAHVNAWSFADIMRAFSIGAFYLLASTIGGILLFSRSEIR